VQLGTFHASNTRQTNVLLWRGKRKQLAAGLPTAALALFVLAMLCFARPALSPLAAMRIASLCGIMPLQNFLAQSAPRFSDYQ